MTDGPTDGWTDKVGCRIARLKRHKWKVTPFQEQRFVFHVRGGSKKNPVSLEKKKVLELVNKVAQFKRKCAIIKKTRDNSNKNGKISYFFLSTAYLKLKERTKLGKQEVRTRL